LIRTKLFSKTINASIDFHNLDKRCFKLEYELSIEYNYELSTQLVLADKQQLCFKKVREIISYEQFGKHINILEVIARSFNKHLPRNHT